MKISEILNKDKQNALKTQCNVNHDDEKKTAEKGITVAQLLRKRRKNARQHKKRRQKAAEERRLVRQNQLNEAAK